MIEEGFFISKESLTPQEWKDFSIFAESLNMSDKEAVLHLMLKQIREEKNKDFPISHQLLIKAVDVFKNSKHNKRL